MEASSWIEEQQQGSRDTARPVKSDYPSRTHGDAPAGAACERPAASASQAVPASAGRRRVCSPVRGLLPPPKRPARHPDGPTGVYRGRGLMPTPEVHAEQHLDAVAGQQRNFQQDHGREHLEGCAEESGTRRRPLGSRRRVGGRQGRISHCLAIRQRRLWTLV